MKLLGAVTSMVSWLMRSPRAADLTASSRWLSRPCTSSLSTLARWPITGRSSAANLPMAPSTAESWPFFPSKPTRRLSRSLALVAAAMASAAWASSCSSWPVSSCRLGVALTRMLRSEPELKQPPPYRSG